MNSTKSPLCSASRFNLCERMSATIALNCSNVGVSRIGLLRLRYFSPAAGVFGNDPVHDRHFERGADHAQGGVVVAGALRPVVLGEPRAHLRRRDGTQRQRMAAESCLPQSCDDRPLFLKG
jgi:hypothetical protein